MLRLTSLALFICVAIVAPAQAATEKPFTQAAFLAAQAQGSPILVKVAAWWCPVCTSQGRTIRKITAAPAYANLVIFEIDYDKQKAEWKQFNVQKQGTLIAFKGKQETARVNFQTNGAVIAAALNSALR